MSLVLRPCSTSKHRIISDCRCGSSSMVRSRNVRTRSMLQTVCVISIFIESVYLNEDGYIECRSAAEGPGAMV